MPGHIYLQTGDFDLAAETNVIAAAADKAFVDRTRYARAMAYAGSGRVREASAEQRRFEQARAGVVAESLYLINNKAGDVMTLAAATLDAELARARGDATAAIAAWRRAVAAEGALQYDEPPAWFYTVRQSLGAALLRAGQATEAEQVFREALATRPRDARLLFGLWQTLLAQQRASEAVLVENQYEDAWRDATAPLTLDLL
jgi:tetratricopeptide (TPR) repeat protein